MTSANSTQAGNEDMIPISVLELVVEKLLVHRERDALRTGLIDLIDAYFKPKSIALYSAGTRGFLTHRGQALSELHVHDLLKSTLEEASLADLHDVLHAVQLQNTLIESNSSEHTLDVAVPLMLGDVVGSVLVVKGLIHTKTSEQIWTYLLEAYSQLANMMYSAEIDHLTGLMNRFAFERLLNQAADDTERAITEQQATYFVLVDIDFFKRINDTFGHLYGDEVLILLSRLMSESFRSMDWLFRYGGEEFAIVLHDVSYEDAYQALERFRAKVEAHSFPQVEDVTISIGFSRMTHNQAISTLIDHSDSALYFSKKNGRNQVNSYEQLLEQGVLADHGQEEGDVELF
jgi:diguanylate cyclase (GGDEF)-like protein